MSRANNGGWDFVKVGGKYQFKDEGLIAEIEILEDNSTDTFYEFKVKVLNANEPQATSRSEDRISHIKNPGGYWSGMMQIFETPEYTYQKHDWI